MRLQFGDLSFSEKQGKMSQTKPIDSALSWEIQRNRNQKILEFRYSQHDYHFRAEGCNTWMWGAGLCYHGSSLFILLKFVFWDRISEDRMQITIEKSAIQLSVKWKNICSSCNDFFCKLILKREIANCKWAFHNKWSAFRGISQIMVFSLLHLTETSVIHNIFF